MAVDKGTFAVYARIEPPLPAGRYELLADQRLVADGQSAGSLPVANLVSHFVVRTPTYSLPPDQILSTFPPATSEGDYGSRLPQVVLRRRTLPWERAVGGGAPATTPWLALVVIAEREAPPEAVLALNQPIGACVTTGVTLDGTADAKLGNCLRIRKSMVDRIFPTQADLPLLAHAREVDLTDTELMMGDDDGFVAVVIANRLPLPGRAGGEDVPQKYLACLVNVEGQVGQLLPEAPDVERVTGIQLVDVPVAGGAVHVGPGAATTATPVASTVPMSTGAPTATGASLTAGAPMARMAPIGAPGHQETYQAMAGGFTNAHVGDSFTVDSSGTAAPDPVLTFPVLLYWSFTTKGTTSFANLMGGVDSAVLGNAPRASDDTRRFHGEGREPAEMTDTGHLGLVHRTRRGDPVRAWYRGPILGRALDDNPRLDLAHAADQLRIAVPDGREDISLAAAFEIGRLLALAHPSMVAAILRWRQAGYQADRREAIFRDILPQLPGALGRGLQEEQWFRDPRVGVLLGQGLLHEVAQRPEVFLGEPTSVITAGRAVPVSGDVAQVLARGFGLDPATLVGAPDTVLDALRNAQVAGGLVDVAGQFATAQIVSGVLGQVLMATVDQVAQQVATASAKALGGSATAGGGA